MPKSKPKNSTKSTDCTQSEIKRDNRGRFTKGSQPPNGFNKHPENIYNIADDDRFNPKHSPRYHLRRLWSMPRDEVKKRILASEVIKGMTYGEYLALKQAERARRNTKDFNDTLNQAEGLPTQPVDVEVKEKRPNPLDGLTLEQLRRLAGDGKPPKRNSR